MILNGVLEALHLFNTLLASFRHVMPSSGLKLQFQTYNSYNKQYTKPYIPGLEGDGPIGGVTRTVNDPRYDIETMGGR